MFALRSIFGSIKKLWPDGYNLILRRKIFRAESAEKNSGSLSKEKLALPKQLVVNNASKRSIFYENRRCIRHHYRAG
ncbi:MAG: hypothetical protein L6V93_19310 [Clostridiales bacterium]|nr:MAG: hypothetical protein L6V93_19310 [Clostridiales bacterium]